MIGGSEELYDDSSYDCLNVRTPLLFNSSYLDLKINGIVTMAEAAFFSLKQKGSFDFKNEFPKSKVLKI